MDFEDVGYATAFCGSEPFCVTSKSQRLKAGCVNSLPKPKNVLSNWRQGNEPKNRCHIDLAQIRASMFHCACQRLGSVSRYVLFAHMTEWGELGLMWTDKTASYRNDYFQ